MPEERKETKITITPEIRRIWLNARKAWNISLDAFSNSLSLLSEKQANALYEIVKVSLYKGSYAEILRGHPELRTLVMSDEDRLFMHDVYENLSWKLGRKEPEPQDLKLFRNMKGRIGRSALGFSG